MTTARWVLVLLALGWSKAEAAVPTVAVSYFDNNSGDVSLEPLARGLADMLITDLSTTGALQVVEREKLNQVLEELKLSKSRFVDPKVSLKLGKGLSAQFILTGSYQVAADTLRIDARLFKVESGKVLVTTKAEGKIDEFFALEKELVDALVEGLALKLGPREKNLLRRNPTQSYTAWLNYSTGLMASDARDEERARQSFQAALKADPSYQSARNAMERLNRIFVKHEQAVETTADSTLATLDFMAKDLPERVEALLVSLDDAKSEQLRRKLDLLQTLAKKNSLPCRLRSGPATGNKTVLNGGIPVGGVISHCPVVQEVMRVAYRLLEDPDTWDDLPKVCEYFIKQLPEDQALLRYCEATIVSTLKAHQREGADAVRAKFEEDRTEALGYEPGDWRRALAENHARMRAAVKAYAKGR